MPSTSSSRFIQASYSDNVASVFYQGKTRSVSLSALSNIQVSYEEEVLEEEGVLEQSLKRFTKRYCKVGFSFIVGRLVQGLSRQSGYTQALNPELKAYPQYRSEGSPSIKRGIAISPFMYRC